MIEQTLLEQDPAVFLERIRAAGWYIAEFPASGVLAANPYYENFSLGISGYWLQVGRQPVNGLFLWLYPASDEIEAILEQID